MGVKTDLEILEGHRNSARAMGLEADINLKRLERQLLVVKPGDVYEKMKKMIAQKKLDKDISKEVLKIIDEMIVAEKKKGDKNA